MSDIDTYQKGQGRGEERDLVKTVAEVLLELAGIFYRQKNRESSESVIIEDELKVFCYLRDNGYVGVKEFLDMPFNERGFEKLNKEKQEQVINELRQFSVWFRREFNGRYGTIGMGTVSIIDRKSYQTLANFGM